MKSLLNTVFGALTASVLVIPPCAYGAEFSPTKPLRFIVPLAAGGSADVAARAIAQPLARIWKQPVIVDNRPGGGTTVATSAIASAPPDGHTFGWVNTAHTI